MSNASALFRSLLVYGLCLPLAVLLGYLLANPLDFATVTVVGVLFFVLAIPLLLRWHHAWLITTWNVSALLFFLPGKPYLWQGLAVASFTIAILQYTLNRRLNFLSAPSVTRPLLFVTVVILVTARLTGGIAFRMLGGDTYGGKRYIVIFAAILGYFAMVNRRIPPKRANLYVTLFFAGAATSLMSNLPGVVSPALNFLFLVFPPISLSAFSEQNSVVGQTALITRTFGLFVMGSAIFCAMLARYGLRGVLDTSKPLRMGLFCGAALLEMSGGFRSGLVLVLLTFAALFYLERLHRTRLLLPVIMVFLVGGGFLMLFATRLPLPIQRSLAALPFVQIDPLVRMDAEGSSEWRLAIWRQALQEVPRYLLVGKGYAFSGTELAQMGRSTDVVSFVGDYHSGPLSTILTFGIFGVIGFLWLLAGGIRTLYHNYKFGDPAYHNINTFLFTYFVVKVIFFCLVFGGFGSDLPMFLGILGLSVSLNGGVAQPVVVPQPRIVFNRFKLHPSVRRPAGA